MRNFRNIPDPSISSTRFHVNMSLKNLFFKDTIIYGFTSYLGLAAAFFLTPIYTRILSKADYGTMDLFNTWNNFFVLILPLGLTAAILRLYVDFENDDDLKKRYLGTLFITIIGTNLLYIGLMFLSLNPIKALYYKDGFVYSLFYISLLIIPLQILTSYFQSLNRIEFKKYTYLAINLTSFLLLTSLGFSLVYFYNYGIEGFFIASLIASGASFLIALFTGYQKIYFSFDFKIFKTAVNYSIYLLLVLVFLRFTYIVDRTLINTFLSIREVGEYAIAIRLGNVMEVFVGGFTTAWFPYAMSLINKEERLATYQKAFKYYLIIFTMLAFLVNLFVKELLLFIAPSYLSIEPISYMIISNAVIAGTAYFFGLGIHIAKRSHLFLVSAIISSIVNVAASYLLINRLGMTGIVLGSIFAIFTWVLIEYFISKKLMGIRFDLRLLFFATSFLCATSIGVYYFNKVDISTIAAISAKIAFSALVIGALLIFEKENTKIIIETLKRRLKK